MAEKGADVKGTQEEEARRVIMKQIEVLKDQIEEMRVSMNEQSLARRKQQQQASKRSANTASNTGKKGPIISRHVKNLDDKILECELADAREGLSYTHNERETLFLMIICLCLIVENMKLKTKLREMVERRRSTNLLWFTVMTVAVVIMAVYARYS